MNCNCAFCKNDLPFKVPDELVSRVLAGQVAIFAGAGISTENPLHAKSTLYDEIRSELGILDTPSFPALMDLYASRPDGRIELINKILHRIDYFRSYSDFYQPMTRFHRAIRPMNMIADIVTTNWDDYFEREAGFTPFVYDADLAFLDTARRRVIKIHGSINNRGSVVATTSDYERAFRRLNVGPLGAYLKTLMSSKTIIYTGYSLRDDNYLRILRSVNRLMGPMRRHSYFVSPVADAAYLEKLPADITLIPTDGAFFFEQLREHINGLEPEFPPIISDDVLAPVGLLSFNLSEYHDKTAALFIETRHPLLILALSYQDGLQHALRRILQRWSTGEYSDAGRVHDLYHAYENKQEGYADDQDYWNASYCAGYKNGMAALLSAHLDDELQIPPMVDVVYSANIDTSPKARRTPRRSIPQEILEELTTILDKTPRDIVPHHLPYV